MQFEIFKAIFFKEHKSFFSTRFSWIYLIFFAFASGALTFYSGSLFEKNYADLSTMFFYQSYIYIFFLPILTMNLWQRDKSDKSFEMLLTIGAKNSTLVLAKYIFAYSIFLIMLLLTFGVFSSLIYLGNIEMRLALSGYLGCLLLGATYLAIGQFASFIAKNQAGAFLINLLFLAIFSIVSFEKLRLFATDFFSQNLSLKLLNFSFQQNFANLVAGKISLSSVVFFVSITIIFLALNTLFLNYYRFKI